MDVAKKTIILTGAARLGKSVATKLGELDANLVITYFKSEEEAKFVCKGCEAAGQRAISVRANLSNSDDVKKVIREAKAAFGSIDGLVHMAATYPRTPWETLKEEDWDNTVAIIAKSAFLLCKFVGDELLKNKSGPNGIKGKMIFFSDWSVNHRPYEDYLPYNSAKGAVEVLAKTAAKELAPHVTVNVIAPGPILAPADLTDEENEEVMSKTPLRRWGGPEEIAKAVKYLLDTDFVTGVVLPVDGGRTIG